MANVSGSFTSLRTLDVWKEPQSNCSQRGSGVVAEWMSNYWSYRPLCGIKLMVKESKIYV